MKGFYHIWAWRPSWSCNPDAANKISFPLIKEAPHKNLSLISLAVSRKRRTDGRRLDGYTISSPCEPNGSGELKLKALECSQDFSHYKSTGIFPDTQGQLTPQSLVRSGRISNSSEMLLMFSLPASMKKIRSKMKALEWSQHYTAIFQTRKGR